MTDLADLRAKVEAATPGWDAAFTEKGRWRKEIEDFKRAANPQTILRLLDLLTPEALAYAMEAEGWEFSGDPVLDAQAILDRLAERQAPR